MAFPVFEESVVTKPEQRYLFVIGFYRSGTTLLYSFLNLHPQIKLLFEADLLNHPLVSVSAHTGKNWWERLDFYNSFCRRHRLTPLPSWKEVTTSKKAADLLYRQYGGERFYIGEKAPSYYNCIPELARQFPDARFIVIWRNPQDVLSSIVEAGKKHHFFSNSSLPNRSIIGFEKMQEAVLALRARGIPVHDLCFEDLAEHPETQLKSICKFLEIPFDPKMLELDQAECSMFPPGEIHTKAKSGRVIKPGQSQKAPQTPHQSKARAYLHRWKQRFGDRLATKLYWPEAAAEAPSAAELMRDRLLYDFARFYSERFTPIIYGSFPLAWLQIYRVWRGKVFAPSSAGGPGPLRSPATHPLKISVITPSYKQLPWLKLCAASVADQKGVAVEHIIQDAQSGPELDAWVRQNTKAELFVECDSGMYDAINRGFARATGDIVCWLNSDEQYLEGSLAKVAHFFETHPEIDVLFGDALLVSNTGTLLSYRRTIQPSVRHIKAAHLNTLSCATFVRRSVIERGFTLNTRWKAIADAVWVVDLLQAGVPTAVLNEPLAAFTITDSNLGQTSLALSEGKLWQEKTSLIDRLLRPYFVVMHRLAKLLNGAYSPRSVSTRLYTLASPETRVRQEVARIGFGWPRVD
jgi:glycosyltransferase involved in cell wall biosynthesis